MLNREEIEKLIIEKNLIEGYIDLNIQLTPNGFDLTIANIYEFENLGQLDFSNKQRQLPECREIHHEKEHSEDKFGWWNLKKGIYKIKTNEKVNLPSGLTALAFSRTSLLRMGAFTLHGVWDAGFRGKSEFILTVDNPFGLRLKQNARIAQLIFMKINETDKGYEGIYQHKE